MNNFQKILLSFAVLISIGKSNSFLSQTKYHSPLGIPLVLSSNFGEIRPNHFHTGLDFKTNGKIGYRIYAIEEGFVSRIKVSPYGYGRVVYIDHPDGKTSVYAHISQFEPKLDSIILKLQQKAQNFEIDSYFKKGEINLTKGESFAFSGNTGGSGGPHLHFELRDTKTEQALNPLLYGFDIADSKKPELRTLKVYGLSKDGYLISGKVLEYKIILSGTNYKLPNPQIQIPANFCPPEGGLGFAIDAIDRFDAASNQCGVFGTKLKIDGAEVFGQKIDGVFFEQSRYVNSHTDYFAYINNKKKYHKLFRNKENILEIYTTENSGILFPDQSGTKNIEIEVSDVKNNISNLTFKVNWDYQNIFSELLAISESDYIMPDKDYLFEYAKGKIILKDNTVYEPMKKYKFEDDYMHLGKYEEPIQNAIEVKIRKTELSFPEEKYYINVKRPNGSNAYLETRYHDLHMIAESKYFGIFQLFIDTIAPDVNFSKIDFTTKQKSRTIIIPFREFQTEIGEYDLYIDGVWVPLEFENKGSYFTYTVDINLTGEHNFHFVIGDICGNKVDRTLKLLF